MKQAKENAVALDSNLWPPRNRLFPGLPHVVLISEASGLHCKSPTPLCQILLDVKVMSHYLSSIMKKHPCWLAMGFQAGVHTQPDKIMCKQCVLKQLVGLVYRNLPMKNLHIVSHIIFAHRPISYLLYPCPNMYISHGIVSTFFAPFP